MAATVAASEQQHGWAPVGQALLSEYAAMQQDAALANIKGSWQDISASLTHLLPWTAEHLKLLYAVDCFPNGGLCQGDQLKEAIRRYEQVWLPLLARQPTLASRQQLVPPLDVAFVWHLHRLCGQTYEADVRLVCGADAAVGLVDGSQAFRFTDGSDGEGAATSSVWTSSFPGEPFWPPLPSAKTAEFSSRLSADLAVMAVRQPIFLHQLLRPEYSQAAFLQRALDRYAKFLILRKRRQVTLAAPVPPLDIEFLQRTHQSANAAWQRDWRELMGSAPPGLAAGQKSTDDMGSLDRSEAGAWRYNWGETRRIWTEDYQEPFVVPGSGYVSMDTHHPAEDAAQGYLAAYNDREGSWRAGAHAIYVAWLQRDWQQQAAAQAAPVRPPAPKPAKKGGLFSCCMGGSAVEEHGATNGHSGPTRINPDAAFKQQLAGFRQLQGLPLTPAHPFYSSLELRGDAQALPSPQAEAPELEQYSRL